MKKLYINKRVEEWLMEKLDSDIDTLEWAIKKRIFRHENQWKKLLNDLKRLKEKLIKQGGGK